MGSSINPPLTDEKSDTLRDEKERLEASELRNAILEGFQDGIVGRSTTYSGDLRADMRKHR